MITEDFAKEGFTEFIYLCSQEDKEMKLLLLTKWFDKYNMDDIIQTLNLKDKEKLAELMYPIIKLLKTESNDIRLSLKDNRILRKFLD